MGFIDDAYTLACEGDVMLCISLLIGRYLTGKNAFAGDLYDLDLDGILSLVHCGAPASLASNRREIVLAKSQLALERGFETLTCRPRLNTGFVTLFRFYGENCDRMHLVSGELLSSKQSVNLSAKIRIDGNRWDFLQNCYGNHYLVVEGDIRNELKLLGKWLGITIFDP
jgi:L-fucose isomerase-like protein